VNVEPFNTMDYDICRLPPIPDPEEETRRMRTATYKIFTVKQAVFLLILIYEVAEIAAFIRYKVFLHAELNSDIPFDNAVFALIEQGSPRIPDIAYLILNPTHLIACIEVLDEQINDFQYFVTHVRYIRRTLDNNPVVK
jgi:hypothetical protein